MMRQLYFCAVVIVSLCDQYFNLIYSLLISVSIFVNQCVSNKNTKYPDACHLYTNACLSNLFQGRMEVRDKVEFVCAVDDLFGLNVIANSLIVHLLSKVQTNRVSDLVYYHTRCNKLIKGLCKIKN